MGRGFVIPGRSQPNSLKMKVLLVLAVVAAGSAHSGEDYKMFMKWAKGKAMESCWGEDNMKLLTLNMKKAVSKCMQKKIEANFGPVEELLQSFNNQINEEQLFFMVNEILQGSDEEYWVNLSIMSSSIICLPFQYF